MRHLGDYDAAMRRMLVIEWLIETNIDGQPDFDWGSGSAAYDSMLDDLCGNQAALWFDVFGERTVDEAWDLVHSAPAGQVPVGPFLNYGLDS